MKKSMILLISLFVFACSTVEVMDVEVDKRENITIAPPPSSQGQASRAYVLQYNFIALYVFPIPEKDITIVFGGHIPDICSGDISGVDVFDLLNVIRDEGDDIPRIHEIATGEEVLLEIWPFADLTFLSSCEPYLNDSPTFSGRVEVKIVDNDLYPNDTENNNVNTFGIMASSDEISMLIRGLWDGYNNDTWRIVACNIRYK